MSRHLASHSTDPRVVSVQTPTTDEGTSLFGPRDHQDDEAPTQRVTEPADDSLAVPGTESAAGSETAARDKFGGVNWGASFFGWLVAVAFAVLLAGIAGAVAAALGRTGDIGGPDAAGGLTNATLVAVGVAVAVLLAGYYAGGYVAGRMSRFDGGRQGLGVWLLSLLVLALAVGLGVLLGRRYDVGSRVDLTPVTTTTDQVGWQVLVGVGLLVVAGSLLAAVLGGVVGRRYHQRVDRVANT